MAAGLRPPTGPARQQPIARAAILATFTALLVHTMAYAGFFEDPITWVLLAAGASLAAAANVGSAVSGYLRRLATTGAAYTAASIVSKLIAVALLPLYTRYLTPADYGAAEVMFAAVVSASIVVRLGLIEALLRFYYKDDEDPARVVSTSFAALFWLVTAAALIALPFAKPISEALLNENQPPTWGGSRSAAYGSRRCSSSCSPSSASRSERGPSSSPRCSACSRRSG